MNYLLTILFLFFSVLLTGDEVLLITSSLIGNNSFHFSLILFIIICILANLTSDIILFLLSKHLIKKFKIKKYRTAIESFIKKVNHPGKSLFFSKFIYGTRIMTILILGSFSKMKFKTFLFYDIFALSIINILVILIGFYYSRTFSITSARLFFLGITLIILILFILKRWTKKKFVQLYLPTTKEKE